MKNQSTKTDELDIPERKRDELGPGVRGKYLERFSKGSNVVVLRPDIHKAFPNSEAVNDALASYLTFAREAKALTRRGTAKASAKRRVAP